MRYAKVSRCENGHLDDGIYSGLWWQWRINRCNTCGVYVLPYIVRYVDPRWLSYAIKARG